MIQGDPLHLLAEALEAVATALRSLGPDQLLTVDQFAERAQYDAYTVRRWLREGRIAGQKVGREWRIPATELRRVS